MEPTQPPESSPIVPPKRSRKVVAVVVTCLLALAGSVVALRLTKTLQQVSSPAVVEVIINNEAFDPATLRIKKDTTVKWTNTGEKPRRIESNPDAKNTMEPLNSKELPAYSGAYSYTFTKSGTYEYHDGFDPVLNAVIVVE